MHYINSNKASLAIRIEVPATRHTLMYSVYLRTVYILYTPVVSNIWVMGHDS